MPIEMPKGLPFSVDTWNPNSNLKRHHFLTHAHKDHCSGITSHFCFPIYSTHLTKSLILHYFPQLDEKLFVEIEVGQSLTVDDPDGSFTVTAFDANHCPGAVMFLFEGEFGNILHTGDCRLTPECLQNLPEKYITKKGKNPSCHLDFVFLDCTFGKSLMNIPSKQSSLQQVINCIWKHPDAATVYLTCNVLGQEEVLVKIFQTFGSKIYVDKAQNPDFYQALELTAPEIISADPSSRFHIFDGFPKLYERARKIILEARENMQPEPLIIRPSAQWYACEETELTVMERKILEKSNIPLKDQFGVWHVCYSMHSSRQELEWALELLAPKWVVSSTPECRAMELEYVKKHCLSTRVSDARFWKVLDITMEASLEAGVLVESSRFSSDMVLTNQENQLPKTLANQENLFNLAPPSKKPPVTLFGRARLGYHSCLSVEAKKTTWVEDGCKDVVNEEVEQQLPSSHNKEDSVEELNEKNIEVEDTDTESDMFRRDATVCKSVSYSYIGLSQQLPSSHSKEDSVQKLNENNTKVEDTDTESDMLRRDTTVCKSVSYSYSGLSRGCSDNFRKLYRSMNVPVPQPLPSLVKLMKSCKRAKRDFDI